MIVLLRDARRHRNVVKNTVTLTVPLESVMRPAGKISGDGYLPIGLQHIVNTLYGGTSNAVGSSDKLVRPREPNGTHCQAVQVTKVESGHVLSIMNEEDLLFRTRNG